MAKRDPFQYYSASNYHLPVYDLKCQQPEFKDMDFCRGGVRHHPYPTKQPPQEYYGFEPWIHNPPTKQPPQEIGPLPGSTTPATGASSSQPAASGTMSLDGIWQSLTGNPLLLAGLAVGAFFLFGKKR